MNRLVGRRTFLILIVGAVTTLVAVFTRILQVAAFSTAAGIRRQFAAETGPWWTVPIKSSVHSGAMARPVAIQNGRGMVTYHPSYNRFDRERVTRALQEAVTLGSDIFTFRY